MSYSRWTPCIPKKTLDLILSHGCDFLVQVKHNCPRLWETLALHTGLTQPISTSEHYGDNRGRQVFRRVELYDNRAELPKGWNGVRRIVKVRRWGFRNGKAFDELSFHIMSRAIYSAAVVADAIRGHWAVENNLHWVKDVNLGEDDMTLRDTGTATILAYLNNTAINILKYSGLKPTKDTFAKISNKVNELYKLF